MRIRLAWILILFSFFGCSNHPEVVGGPLTKEVLQRHLVDLGPVRYTADDGWNWTCERVYVILRQSSTDAEVRVYERGNKRKGAVRGGARYEAGSRNATYHLVRNSVNDDWYINTSEGEPVRKFGILKIQLALRTGEFVKTEKPEKTSKSLKPKEPLAISQAEDIPPELRQTEGNLDSQSSEEDELVALGKESAITPASIAADAPVQEVTSQTLTLIDQDLIRNGDFSDSLSQWEKTHSSKVEDKWEVAVKDKEKYLSWSREQSGSDGGTVGVVQQMEANVREFRKLILSIDVRVSSHTLSGPGWWAEQRGGSGEYPVKILIYYKDVKDRPHVWTHGFLSDFKGRTNLKNFSNSPRDTWYHYEADLMDVAELVDMDFQQRGQRLPLPAKITAIKLLGQGWDFVAAVDNVKLLGEM